MEYWKTSGTLFGFSFTTVWGWLRSLTRWRVTGLVFVCTALLHSIENRSITNTCYSPTFFRQYSNPVPARELCLSLTWGTQRLLVKKKTLISKRQRTESAWNRVTSHKITSSNIPSSLNWDSSLRTISRTTAGVCLRAVMAISCVASRRSTWFT